MFKKKWFYLVIGIIILIILGIIFGTKQKPPEYETAPVLRGDLQQEVSVTGTVKPAEAVELSFEKSGKITSIKVKVGDEVKNNKILVEMANTDLVAQLKQAQASLENAHAQMKQYQAGAESQKAKLDELKAGTRPEEIASAQTTVNNAEKSLLDANLTLQNIQEKADKDLTQAYNNTLNTLAYAVTIAENSLYALTDVQSNMTNQAGDQSIVTDKKANAVFALLGASNGGNFNKSALSQLSGGAKG
ncbi:MAG: biotin/lipoyl-binding protein, partial [Patescibacteria group bacterium]